MTCSIRSRCVGNLARQDEIRPTDEASVIRLTDNSPELSRMRWGLVPFHHRGPLKAFKLATLNARAETVATSPTFRDAFRRRRTLIVANGWVEWKGEGKPKPKFYIERADATPIAFAGLWERCRPSDCEPLESFTIVTQPPGALSDIHDRAPVVLTPDQWLRWLNPEQAKTWLFPADSATGHLVEHKADRDDLSKWGNDLRQTYRTVGQVVGVNDVDMHLLNHSLPGVNAGYITRHKLLGNHLRKHQQAISRLIIETTDQRLGSPSCSEWLRPRRQLASDCVDGSSWTSPGRARQVPNDPKAASKASVSSRRSGSAKLANSASEVVPIGGTVWRRC